MKTIRQQLLLGLSCGTAACILAAGAALYLGARAEVNQLSDLQLQQIAAALPNQLATQSVPPPSEDPDEDIVIQSWDAQGRLQYASRASQALPRFGSGGLTSVIYKESGWRVYVERRLDHYVQVAQPMVPREELAATLALRIFLPLLLLLPVLAGLIFIVVGRAMRPLERVAQALAGRTPSALQPLELGDLPPELQPIVAALNSLLGKIDLAMAAQRNFVADAAHELRSPLTALKLQLQLAERSGSGEGRDAAFAKLHGRLDRASHLVQQLLTLARQEAEPAEPVFAALDLLQLVQSVVADHSTLAESRSIDLGVDEAAVAVVLWGDDAGLRILLNNLIDNALRYTQCGGRVDVSCGSAEGAPHLRVRDNGPGVPLAERGRLFDRFYRPDGNAVWGCGLGLSIVKNIAQRHCARVELSDGLGGVGLTVALVFPLQP